MAEYKYSKYDFENPSLLFRLDDFLKDKIGGPFYYMPYYKTFKLGGDEAVLDFGCGGGGSSKCLISLLDESGRLTCIDASNYWIGKAKKRLRKHRNVECFAGDIRELSIPENAYDVISIIHVIHDIEPLERKGIVNSLCRRLKKGGRLFIWEPVKQSHGMPADEIRSLFEDENLKETDYTLTKSWYKGAWQK